MLILIAYNHGNRAQPGVWQQDRAGSLLVTHYDTVVILLLGGQVDGKVLVCRRPRLPYPVVTGPDAGSQSRRQS